MIFHAEITLPLSFGASPRSTLVRIVEATFRPLTRAHGHRQGRTYHLTTGDFLAVEDVEAAALAVERRLPHSTPLTISWRNDYGREVYRECVNGPNPNTDIHVLKDLQNRPYSPPRHPAHSLYKKVA